VFFCPHPLACHGRVVFIEAMDYRGLRATIMGLGHFGGGAAAARWLAGQGATVTVSDAADEIALADSLPLLTGVPIAALHLGGHRDEDFQQAALIVVNPAVRPDSPWLRMARQSAARLTTELELFIENCPARIIGVTGSNGKSTTAAMIATILNAAGQRAFLGGNIGGSLLDDLPQMTADDWVVLEISSFQLWHFAFCTPHAPREYPAHAVCRIHVAVVTGCTPNHLDWHADFSDYVAAKQRILSGQTPDDCAVLNTFDAEVASWRPLVRGRLVPIGGADNLVCPGTTADKNVCPTASLEDLPLLLVPGEHNRANAACAAAAAMAAGCTFGEVQRGLETFRGLPQRLELIATIDGRQFYNDSTATTPESTVAALRSLDAPLWLLAGGKSKGFDFTPLAAEIVNRASGAALFGSVRGDLIKHIAAIEATFPCTAVETMQAALDWCWRRSRPGDAIVLSPACASTDQFRNFRQRGQQFVEMVRRLVAEGDSRRRS
jgi:UDP-N-acetylmuramoylalanine--D-glutamate ligase